MSTPNLLRAGALALCAIVVGCSDESPAAELDPLDPGELRPTGWSPPETGWRLALRAGPSEPAPDWKGRDREVEVETLEVRRGTSEAAVRGVRVAGASVRVACAGPHDLRDVLHVRMRVEDAVPSALEVRLEVALGERRLAKPWERIELVPRGSGRFGGPVALRFTREQRVAAADEVVVSIRGVEDGVVLRSFELLPPLPEGWRPLLESRTSEPRRVRCRTEARRGWVLAGGQSLVGSLRPPEGGSILLFGVAYPPEWTFGEQTLVRLLLNAPGGGSLGSLEIPPLQVGVWQPVRVDLPPGTPGPIDVRLQFQADGPAAVGIEVPALFAPSPDAPTVVFVSSDTHRGDHVDVAAHSAGARTPALDALAARGLVFEDAQSSTNVTVPSHAALLTGLHPRDTGVVENLALLSSDAATLAQAFSDAGYLTLGVASSHLLQSFEHGFDRFDAPSFTRVGEDTLAVLDRWMPEASGRPLFLFVHLYDAHAVYEPPERFERMYWPADRDPFDPALEPPSEGRIPRGFEGLRDLDYVRARYKGEVSYVDDLVGRLLARPRMANAVVAFTADHGESLGEHGIWWAHKDLYRDTVHVPLLLSWPGGPSGAVSDAPVDHLGLGRTLLDLAGLEETPFPGTSLLAAAAADEAARRPLFALSGARMSASIRHGRWHLVRALAGPRAGRVELFDLDADPTGTHDVAADHPETAAEMGDWLERWLSETPESDLLGGYRSDPASLRKLGELGYLDADDADDPDDGTDGR